MNKREKEGIAKQTQHILNANQKVKLTSSYC